MKKRTVSALLSFVFILCAFICVPTVSSASASAIPPVTDYYCREALGKLPNADALLFAYDRIVDGVESSLEKIDVVRDGYTLTTEEINTVYDAYMRDHTEHFWLGKAYSISKNSKTVLSISPSYELSGAELAAARQVFDSTLSAMVSMLNDGDSEYGRALFLHDLLAERVTYEESAHAHDAYGALVLGEAVCEGYAKAYQCLLKKAGILSFTVTGSSVNPSSGSSEGHAWNIVRIDRKYYHVDLTWNDQKTNLFHAYFNLTDDEIKRDHVIDEPAFSLPVCNSTDKNYFKVNGGILTDYSAVTVARRLSETNLITSVYVGDRVDEFILWYDANIRDIAALLGVKGGLTYGYRALGGEVVINIDDCAHKSLTFIPERAATCTADGNIAHYACTCGRLFSDSRASHTLYSADFTRIRSIGHVYTMTEDESRLRKEASSCLEHYTYWIACEGCGEVLGNEYFESARRGEHTPGDPATAENDMLCLLCSEVLSPRLKAKSSFPRVILISSIGIILLLAAGATVILLEVKRRERERRRRRRR